MKTQPDSCCGIYETNKSIKMKREIKFRAWDKEEKKLCHVDVISFGQGCFLIGNSPTPEKYDVDERLIYATIPEGHFVDFDELDLMQFTGLKDKNDKEIYEGDIIKTPTDKPMVISWSEKFASFCINRDGWAFQHWFGEACDPKDCEVIGNIFENLELINQ